MAQGLQPLYCHALPVTAEDGNIGIKGEYPLDRFKSSYIGMRHKIWEKIPQDIIVRGSEKGWMRIIRQSKKFLINK